MKNAETTVPERKAKSAITVFVAAIVATVLAGVATVALLYFLILQFQS